MPSGAGRWCCSAPVGRLKRRVLPPGSVRRNCRTPCEVSLTGPILGSPRVGTLPYASFSPARKVRCSASISATRTTHVLYDSAGRYRFIAKKCS